MLPRENQDGRVEAAEQLSTVYRQRAFELAVPRDRSAEMAATLPVLAFTVSGERFGLELSALGGIIPLERYTVVPGAPAELLGIINHRGRLCSVLDLARLLGLPLMAPEEGGTKKEKEGQRGGADSPAAYILLLRRGGQEVGLRIDGVEGIQRIAPEDLLPLGDLAPQDKAQSWPAVSYAGQRTRDGLTLLRADALRFHPLLEEDSPP